MSRRLGRDRAGPDLQAFTCGRIAHEPGDIAAHGNVAAVGQCILPRYEVGARVLKSSRLSRVRRILLIAFQIIACAGFLGLVGFEIWSAERCRYAQNCGSYQRASNSPEHESLNFAGWEPKDALDRYTLLLAIFTAALAVTSIFQGVLLLRADRTARTAADAALKTAQTAITQAGHLGSSVEQARRAADEMANVAVSMKASAKSAAEANVVADRSARVVNRAYAYFVLEDQTCREFFIKAVKGIEFRWRAQNFGKTPARLIASGSAIVINDVFPIPFPYLQKLRFGKVVLAESERSDPFVDQTGDLSTEDSIAVLNGDKRIWFAGGVDYTDVFGTKQTTNWAFFYDKDRRELSTDGIPPSFNFST
jgi:hypothetical protein